MKMRFSSLPMAEEMAGQLEAVEAQQVKELGAREDTFTMTFSEGDALRGYAVFSPDDVAGYVVIYMARSMMKGLAQMVASSLFGAASLAGKPLRVHTTKLQGVAAMMGANLADLAADADGLPMGIFGHGV